MNRILASLALLFLLTSPQLANAQEDYQDRGASRRPIRSARVGVPSRWQGSPADRRVSSASHIPAEEYIEGEIIVEGEHYIEEDYGCDSCGGGGCDSCGITNSSSFCDGCSAPHRFCICFPAHGWAHAEYLNWYAKGMDLPALVTTSPDGTARNVAGVLGQPTTSVLYGGNNNALDGNRSGFRIRFGVWMANFPGWAIAGEYTGLGDKTESFFQQSTGSPILARPFFNARDGAEDAQMIAFPGEVTGSVGVDVTSRFEGAAFRLRRQLCGTSGCGYSALCCTTIPTSSRLDLAFGYRHWGLTESLVVREQLQLATTNPSGSFDITDRFETRNQFNGFELGFLWQGRRGWWSLDALMRLGIGNVKQTVTISGQSQIIENGVASNHNVGILTQNTNIGTYGRDRFTMVPELGLTLGYQITKRLRGTFGYSSIYWGNVVRPGDQVDLDLNPNLFPPQVSNTGPQRPQFVFNETDYWVHGLSFGGEFRW